MVPASPLGHELRMLGHFLSVQPRNQRDSNICFIYHLLIAWFTSTREYDHKTHWVALSPIKNIHFPLTCCNRIRCSDNIWRKHLFYHLLTCIKQSEFDCWEFLGNLLSFFPTVCSLSVSLYERPLLVAKVSISHKWMVDVNWFLGSVPSGSSLSCPLTFRLSHITKPR